MSERSGREVAEAEEGRIVVFVFVCVKQKTYNIYTQF